MLRSRWNGPAWAMFAILLAVPCKGTAEGAPTPATLDQVREWNASGRWADAERASRALLAEAERTSSPDSVRVAEVLDELAVALRRGGKAMRPEALEVCERAVRIKERAYGRQDLRFAASLHNLGAVYYARKDYEAAVGPLTEALEIRENALGRNDPAVAKTLLFLGSLLSDLDRNDEARPVLERAVEVERVALGPGNPDRALGLNALACLLWRMGELASAIPLFEEAIEILGRGKTESAPILSTCYHNLGGLLGELGDFPRAIEMSSQAARVRESNGDSTLLATSLINLGDEYRHVGDLARSRAILQRAVGILESQEYGSPEDLAWALTHLGMTCLEQNDLAGADEALNRARRSIESVPGPEHGIFWINLRALAQVAERRGETGIARAHYERTLDYLRSTFGPWHPDYGRTLARYSSFQLKTGDSLAALNTAILAAEVNRENLRLTARGLSERLGLAFQANLPSGLDVALEAVSGGLGAQSTDAVRRAWDAVIRSRALVLDEAAERSRVVGGAGDVLEAARQLDAARSRLANLLVRSPMDDGAARSQARIAVARDDVDRCERVLAARSAAFRSGRERASIGLDQVLASLPAGAALVSIACYGEGRQRSYAALVAGVDRTARVVPLGAADPIDRLVSDWRRLAARPPGGGPAAQAAAESQCRAAGRSLRTRAWDPFAPLLEGARMVLVVPDGAYHLLNLAALPAAGATYLVESSPVIHYVSAERDLASLDRTRSRGTGLMAVGGPEFDRRERSTPPMLATSSTGDSTSDERSSPAVAYRAALAGCGNFQSVRFSPLPETEREIDDIARMWGAGTDALVLRGDAAGERAVKELLPGRRVGHLATHGFFLDARCASDRGEEAGTRGIGGVTPAGTSPPDPRPTVTAPAASPLLVSGLALAGANLRASAGPKEEDGILTAEEIASLDLSSLEWVVLSACDTGLGDIRVGEGVLGIRRAFQTAGAGSLIMSLWAVEDRAAGEWMHGLYEGRFQRRLATAEAVREADLGLLKSLRTQGRSTHPFYWAAFVAVGDWR